MDITVLLFLFVSMLCGSVELRFISGKTLRYAIKVRAGLQTFLDRIVLPGAFFAGNRNYLATMQEITCFMCSVHYRTFVFCNDNFARCTPLEFYSCSKCFYVLSVRHRMT